MDRRLFLLASLALGGCAALGPPTSGADGPLAELEPLYAARTDGEGLTIRVKSAGCAAKADFAFYVERSGGAVGVAFARKAVETCKPVVPGQAKLAFSWAELGLPPKTPITVLNPIAPRT